MRGCDMSISVHVAHSNIERIVSHLGGLDPEPIGASEAIRELGGLLASLDHHGVEPETALLRASEIYTTVLISDARARIEAKIVSPQMESAGGRDEVSLLRGILDDLKNKKITPDEALRRSERIL
jgi:hypothetical protein